MQERGERGEDLSDAWREIAVWCLVIVIFINYSLAMKPFFEEKRGINVDQHGVCEGGAEGKEEDGHCCIAGMGKMHQEEH